MKILVLATPRSGSTSLTILINAHMVGSFNYKLFIEPYNADLDNSITSILPLQLYDNLLVKNLFLYGYENEYPIDSFDNVYQYFDWCYSFFDKIVILDRKNKLHQSESFAFNETMVRKKGTDWHTPKIYDMNKIDPIYVNTMMERYINSSNILKSISIDNKIPLVYYEDIFDKHNTNVINDLFKYLDLELVESYYKEFILSPDKRVRIEPSQIKLI